MGDRAHILMKGEGVNLYTHCGGTGLDGVFLC